jgi:hypothetical protein
MIRREGLVVRNGKSRLIGRPCSQISKNAKEMLISARVWPVGLTRLLEAPPRPDRHRTGNRLPILRGRVACSGRHGRGMQAGTCLPLQRARAYQARMCGSSADRCLGGRHRGLLPRRSRTRGRRDKRLGDYTHSAPPPGVHSADEFAHGLIEATDSVPAWPLLWRRTFKVERLTGLHLGWGYLQEGICFKRSLREEARQTWAGMKLPSHSVTQLLSYPALWPPGPRVTE